MKELEKYIKTLESRRKKLLELRYEGNNADISSVTYSQVIKELKDIIKKSEKK